jgi:hypothetical protein
MDALATHEPVAIDSLTAWEDLCSAGAEAREKLDSWRWYVGDLANRVVTLFPSKDGDDERTLAEFAKDINMKKKSVYQYRQVAAFYPVSTRVEFDNLTYTHYRDAMRLKDINRALEWLEECSRKSYTTDEAAFQLSEQLGTNDADKTKIFDKVVKVRRRGDAVIFLCDAIVENGERYQITIREVE